MKILVVGAGFAGATVARELAEHGHEIQVIERRGHIAGNAFDYINPETKITVHKYGPHIFHTKNREIFEWLSRFTGWVEYKHKVKAQLADGRYVTLPVNRETKEIVGAENIVDTFYRPYSEKMWGMKLEDLDPSILRRIPGRDDDNELYFPDDEFQFMPEHGYTNLIANMLDHDNISVLLNVEYESFDRAAEFDFTFNSMPIDAFFDYDLGRLPYRSIKFHSVTLPAPKMLPAAVVNFTHTGPNTRVTEWKQFPGHGANDKATILTFEEPCDYEENGFERYYPVKDLEGKNRELYRRYRDMVPDNMQFIGRCGLYTYVDMDMCVASSLATAQAFIRKHSMK